MTDMCVVSDDNFWIIIVSDTTTTTTLLLSTMLLQTTEKKNISNLAWLKYDDGPFSNYTVLIKFNVV